jgi:hypothetical protein
MTGRVVLAVALVAATAAVVAVGPPLGPSPPATAPTDTPTATATDTTGTATETGTAATSPDRRVPSPSTAPPASAPALASNDGDRRPPTASTSGRLTISGQGGRHADRPVAGCGPVPTAPGTISSDRYRGCLRNRSTGADYDRRVRTAPARLSTPAIHATMLWALDHYAGLYYTAGARDRLDAWTADARAVLANRSAVVERERPPRPTPDRTDSTATATPTRTPTRTQTVTTTP